MQKLCNYAIVAQTLIYSIQDILPEKCQSLNEIQHLSFEFCFTYLFSIYFTSNILFIYLYKNQAEVKYLWFKSG